MNHPSPEANPSQLRAAATLSDISDDEFRELGQAFAGEAAVIELRRAGSSDDAQEGKQMGGEPELEGFGSFPGGLLDRILVGLGPVSYTHLTLPTIYSV